MSHDTKKAKRRKTTDKPTLEELDEIAILASPTTSPKNLKNVTKVLFPPGNKPDNATGIAKPNAANVLGIDKPATSGINVEPPEDTRFDRLNQTLEKLAAGMQTIHDNLSYQDYDFDNFDLNNNWTEEPQVPIQPVTSKATHEISEEDEPPVLVPVTDSSSSSTRKRTSEPSHTVTSASVPPKSVKQAFLAGLTQASGTQEQRGPALDDSMAESLNKLMRQRSDDADELRKNTFPPANCDGLCPVKVNAEVWSRVSANAKTRDLRMQNVGNFLVAGTTHLSYLVDRFTSHWDQDTGYLSNDQAMKIFDHARQAMVLFGTANYELQMRRREMLRAEMNPSHVHLCAPSVSYTTELFGDDVTKKISEITSQNRVTNNAMRGYNRGRARASRRGRFRGRFRGYGHGRGYNYPQATEAAPNFSEARGRGKKKQAPETAS